MSIFGVFSGFNTSRSKILDSNDILAILNGEYSPSLEDSGSEVKDEQIIDDVQCEDENNYMT